MSTVLTQFPLQTRVLDLESLATKSDLALALSEFFQAPTLPPTGLGWNNSLLPLAVVEVQGRPRVLGNPRKMVNPAIWTGAALHVDGTNGLDANSGLGSFDGDFSAAKRNIHAAITAGNATGAPYRVIVKAGEFTGTSLSLNGTVEPSQAVALLAWGGRVSYQSGLFSYTWAAGPSGGYQASITSVSRLFRTDNRTAEGAMPELTLVSTLADCVAQTNTWHRSESDVITVNIGKAVQPRDICVIRHTSAIRYLNHSADFYMQDFDIIGGSGGSFQFEAVADRNIVAVNCRFGYNGPGPGQANRDAVHIRRTRGLVWFQDCDASGGAKDNWNFHEDDHTGLYVLMENCTGTVAGWNGEISTNAFTTHDGAIAAVIGGTYGGNAASAGGSTLHCIEQTKTWLLGTTVTDFNADGNGNANAIRCSNSGMMWLHNTRATASGSARNAAIEADGGQIFARNHQNISGTVMTSAGGTFGSY